MASTGIFYGILVAPVRLLIYERLIVGTLIAMNSSPKQPSRPSNTESAFAAVVERNINALLERRQQEEKAKRTEERVADRITAFTGSMRFVYLHLVGFGLWIAINAGLLPLPRFDPSFVILAMFASVEAIFLSTFVLISQNRMAALADKRSDLDLQVDLLAEHEVTRLIQLVTAIANHLGLDEAKDPELAELAQDVLPETVMEQIEATERKYTGEEPIPG
jgi:uncharacterized membrane protein